MPNTAAPTNLLKSRARRGGLAAHYEAKRAAEPKGLGFLENEKAPKYFNAAEAEHWDELRHEMPPRVATEFDRASLTRAAVLGAALKTDRYKYNMSMHREYMKILINFGMTPAARSKVSQTQNAPANSFDSDV